MARKLSLYPATLPISPEEENARQSFIQSIRDDYGKLTDSDEHLLMLASIQYVLAIRLGVFELETGNYHLAARTHPLNNLSRLLNDMSATRASRLRAKQPTNDSELSMKDFLLSLSEEPVRRVTIPPQGNNHSATENGL